MPKKAKQREKRVVSARKRVTEHVSGMSMASMVIPKDFQLFKVNKPGIYRFDIIPYEVKKGRETPGGNTIAEEGELYFERTFYVHRGIGPENSTYSCLSRTFKKPCPICEARSKLARDADADEELVEALKPRERQLFNVIDVTDPDKGIQIFEYSFYLFGRVLDEKIKSADENEYDFVFDIEHGMTIRANFVEKKMGANPYYECIDIEFKPRKTPYTDDIIEEAADLDAVPRLVPYKELKEIYYQAATTNGEEEESKPKKGGKKVEEEEDQEEEDEDEEEVTADVLGIVIGSMVDHPDHGECEVTHISSDGTSLRLKTEDDTVVKGIATYEVTLLKVEEEEEEEDLPSKKGKKPVAKKGKKVEEEEEESDEEEEEPEEDEEEDLPSQEGQEGWQVGHRQEGGDRQEGGQGQEGRRGRRRRGRGRRRRGRGVGRLISSHPVPSKLLCQCFGF